MIFLDKFISSDTFESLPSFNPSFYLFIFFFFIFFFFFLGGGGGGVTEVFSTKTLPKSRSVLKDGSRPMGAFWDGNSI